MSRAASSNSVLVTGAVGLVGSAVVERLAQDGHQVVATDLDVAGNRKKAARLRRSSPVELRWADLTEPGQVQALVSTVAPVAIVHLAAVIPPLCYRRRELARRVNVEATRSLLRAASQLASPPRFLLASSVAVYGARNPHHCADELAPSTPVDPCDLYGAHKVEAEAAVTTSGLEWVILRLGGVLTPEPRWDAGLDAVRFESVLPADGRIQTVDVRDVARAFAAAVTTDDVKEVFLVGGDASHRMAQSALGASLAESMGFGGVLGSGRPGDPDDDRGWFTTDWMDTGRAQEVLSFQHHSFPELVAETRRRVGWRRWPLAASSAPVGAYLRWRAPDRPRLGPYAELWGAIERTWGDPRPDRDPDCLPPH